MMVASGGAGFFLRGGARGGTASDSLSELSGMLCTTSAVSGEIIPYKKNCHNFFCPVVEKAHAQNT